MTENNLTTTWQPITTMQDWKDLDQMVNGFHDGVIKEMNWSHGEYVNQNLEMVYARSPRLWLLIQLQCSQTPGVEILFAGVRECSINAANDLEPYVLLEADQIVFSLSANGASRVIAETCEYRICGTERLGPGPFQSPL